MSPSQASTFTPFEAAVAEKGLSPSREQAQEGILWDSERETPIVPLLWPKKEEP